MPAASRRSTRSDERRRRFFGLFGSQAPQPSAGRGTPPDEPQPRMVNFKVMLGANFAKSAGFNQTCADCIKLSAMAAPPAGRGTLENSRKKFSVVFLAMASNETPR